MLLPRRNSLPLVCLLLVCLSLACCQKVDATEGLEPLDAESPQGVTTRIAGTGKGTLAYPYTVADLLASESSNEGAVWVIGYVVGTARLTMNNAVFDISAADNQSNILLSNDSLCADASQCIPVELKAEKSKLSFSLPKNIACFRKCLLLKGIPSTYLNRKGLRKVSEGLWLVGFDISTVGPTEWASIIL